ncbi:MAG: hypothetical protein F7B60_05055 [Desulfurococcales archaeon]|nr:hypothetical protein [Desulfurococcales archaeon]
MAKERGKIKRSMLKEAVMSTISHSTEDLEKVKASIVGLFPRDIRDEYLGKFTLRTFKGFHGNEIRLLQVVVNGKDAILLLENILCNLKKSFIGMLLDTLDERTDRSGNLYLRLGKQDAFKGRIELCEGDDTIRIIFKPQYHGKDFWTDIISNHIIIRCNN